MKNAIPSALYVIRSESGLVKLGRSVDPEKRLKVVSRSSGFLAHLHHVTPIREDASFVEAAAHKVLESKRRTGEWFDVTAEEAVAAIASAIEAVDEWKNKVPRFRGTPSVKYIYKTFRLPTELDERVTDYCMRHKVSRHELMSRALVWFIDDWEQQEAKRGARR